MTTMTERLSYRDSVTLAEWEEAAEYDRQHPEPPASTQTRLRRLFYAANGVRRGLRRDIANGRAVNCEHILADKVQIAKMVLAQFQEQRDADAAAKRALGSMLHASLSVAA